MGAVETMRLALRFALRELRGGLSGFYVFMACIALGAAAIGGVNAVSQAITQGISSQGQSILGGDVRFELVQRDANPKELSYLKSLGTLAQSASSRSMARRADQSDQALVEIKAIDDLYPLYGEFVTAPAYSFADLGKSGDDYGIYVQPILLDRLSVAVGDELLIGEAKYKIRGTIITEPDAFSNGFGLAPRLIMSRAGLQASGLIQPGSLVERVYKVRTDANMSDAQVLDLIKTANEKNPLAGWSTRTRVNAAPSLTSSIKRFAQFLTLVGLTALVTGGVGVANAVRAFLDSKRSVIATFKCLGAPGALVSTIYLFQILLIGAIGIVIGLVLAAVAPYGAKLALDGVIPLPSSGFFYPSALALALLFSVLTILVFALLPLGRARDIPASSLFRDHNMSTAGWPRAIYLIGAGTAALLLAGCAIYFSVDRVIAAYFLIGVVFAFVILRAVSLLLMALAKRVGSVKGTPLRLAIGNIHRAGALTPSVVLALGLGLTLLVSLALIDGNLRSQIAGSITARAPNFFFVDIQPAVVKGFSKLVEAEAGDDGKLVRVPMLRGRIIEFNGQDVKTMDIPKEARWVLRGDRGITYAKAKPENATLLEGTWWPADYSGEPLVSFAAEEGAELGLKIGDTVTVNVLGRNITAKISNFRQVEWESMAINFVMVFSPNTFAGAPHSWLATLVLPDADAAKEKAILTSVTKAFPAVTTVRVKDAIDMVNTVVGQLASAIRAAAIVALVASVLVLAGALAAGNRARVHDAVILKTLGATRRTLIAAFVTEYAILGAATAFFALLAGSFASWFIVTKIMDLSWAFQPWIAVSTIAIALVCTVGFGLAGTWRILGQKAAPVLRNL